MSQKPEALRLATILDSLGWRSVDSELREASAMLRNQHAEIERLRAELEESEQKIRIWRATFLHAETERGAYKMECKRLRAELEALRNQEPAYWIPRRAYNSSRATVTSWTFKLGSTDVPLFLTAGAQPAPSVPLPGDGKRLSEQLKNAAQNLAFACAGHVDMSLRAMQEMFALIDEVCVGIDSPQPAPSAPEVTDTMALAFHCALTAGRITAQKVDEIKVGLRAALAAAQLASTEEHITDGSKCWCDPDLAYKDPETGTEVWVHRGKQ